VPQVPASFVAGKAIPQTPPVAKTAKAPAPPEDPRLEEASFLRTASQQVSVVACAVSIMIRLMSQVVERFFSKLQIPLPLVLIRLNHSVFLSGSKLRRK
jgi:hypothetical protein